MSDPFLGKTIGGFRIIHRIGRGGMGLVFEAEEVALRDRRVALKILPLEFAAESKAIERFKREAEIAASLDHPNIVRVYAVGEETGLYYYAMKYIEGCSLAQVIAAAKSYGPEVKAPQPGELAQMETADPGEHPEAAAFLYAQPEEAPESSPPPKEIDALAKERFRRAAEIISQAAEGLQYAHQRQVIHRDIKPGNLMIDEQGNVLIADFGLATDVQSKTLTISGSLMGTPAYMSPEQVTAARIPVDHRTDIYSLGATLYELLTLKPVFEAETREKLLQHIVMKEPRRPQLHDKRVPLDLDTIAMKALEKDVDRRYQSAQEMAGDLNRYLSDVPILARPPTLVDKTVKFVRRNKAQVSIASLTAALLIVIFGIVLAIQMTGKRAQIGEFLEEAKHAESEKEYDEALKFYEKVLAIDAGHVEARIKSAELEGKIPRLRAEAEAKRRREQAERLVEEGEALAAQYSTSRGSLADQQKAVKELSKKFRGYEPIEVKKPLWEAQDKVKEAQDKITETFGSAVNKFVQALSLDPECKPAKSNLADLYWRRFTEAEKAQSRSEMSYFGKLLEAYDAEERYTEKLKGDGTIEVTSDPTGAEVYLYEYIEKDRVLTPSNERRLGVTPIAKQPLAMGSYLLILRRDGYRDVRYPVLIERQEAETADIKMYTDEEIGENFVYIPAGEFIMGGDDKAFGSVERRKEHVEGFLIAKFEVTCGEYLEFINDLAERDPQEASRRVPRTAPKAGYYWKKGEDGKYVCKWDLKWPILGVSWEDANAYLKWKSEKDGIEYRLPMDAEWEKAARGVDARIYPWGNQFDPTFCKMRLSREEIRPNPEAIGTFEKDESPYGVRDMAGSILEWCGDLKYNEDDSLRLLRGGACSSLEVNCRAATRYGEVPDYVPSSSGFRCARTLFLHPAP